MKVEMPRGYKTHYVKLETETNSKILIEENEAKGLFAKVWFGLRKPVRGSEAPRAQQPWEPSSLFSLNGRRQGPLAKPNQKPKGKVDQSFSQYRPDLWGTEQDRKEQNNGLGWEIVSSMKKN